MDLAELSKQVSQKLNDAIPTDLADEERQAIAKIVQQAVLDASEHTHEEVKGAAVACCGPDADLAHKLQKLMDQKRDMLIANLSSMR